MIQKSISWRGPAYEETELSEDHHISTAVSQVVSEPRRFQTKRLHEVDFPTFFIVTNPQIHIKIQFSSSAPKPWKLSCLKFSILQSRFLKCSFSLSRFQTKKLHLEQIFYVHNQESRPREANVRSEMHLRCDNL